MNKEFLRKMDLNIHVLPKCQDFPTILKTRNVYISSMEAVAVMTTDLNPRRSVRRNV